MFDFSKSCQPFYGDRLRVSGLRGVRRFEIPSRGCVTSAELIDPTTGGPCGALEWSVCIRFADWPEVTDPQAGDVIRLAVEQVELKVSRVVRRRQDGEYVLTCHERESKVRNGL